MVVNSYHSFLDESFSIAAAAESVVGVSHPGPVVIVTTTHSHGSGYKLKSIVSKSS